MHDYISGLSEMPLTLRHLILAALPALVQPPPSCQEYFQYVQTTIIALSQPPPDPVTDIRYRLFFRDVNFFKGRDVFLMFARNRYHFYEMTCETPETFLQLVQLISVAFNRCKLRTMSLRNACLLFLIWLRHYPSYFFLATLFNISVSSVHQFIRRLMPVFNRLLKPYIKWPSRREWNAMRGTWPELPDAVGSIDGTSHEIYRPIVEPQEQYYSGHRQYHAIHTQIIVDNAGTIRFIQSGFLGHLNDAQQFAMMDQLGTDLPFPQMCYLLGDKIYPNRGNVLTQYTAQQIGRKQGVERRKCLKFNRYVKRYRIGVEHAIATLKVYKSVASIWRHPRPDLPSVTCICAGLVCRKKELGLIL